MLPLGLSMTFNFASTINPSKRQRNKKEEKLMSLLIEGFCTDLIKEGEGIIDVKVIATLIKTKYRQTCCRGLYFIYSLKS